MLEQLGKFNALILQTDLFCARLSTFLVYFFLGNFENYIPVKKTQELSGPHISNKREPNFKANWVEI